MYVILGSAGFLGKNIESVLKKNNLPYKSYARPVFNMNNESTFKNVELLNSPEITIIDCVVKIDGTESEIEGTNVTGFTKWINYLKKNFPRPRYVYLSSYTVLLESIYSVNFYIKTKRTAESVLRESGLNHKIIRLTFPFGKGESGNRLLSRLVKKIKAGDPLKIDSFSTNFTPIAEFNSDAISLLESGDKEINYASSNLISLKELVEYMYLKLGMSPAYELSGNTFDIEVKDNYKKNSDKSLVFSELNHLINV